MNLVGWGTEEEKEKKKRKMLVQAKKEKRWLFCFWTRMAFPIDHEKVDTCMEWLGWEMDVDGWTLLLFVGSVGWAVRTRSRGGRLRKWIYENGW